MARAYSCKHTPFKWSFARAHERRWLPGGRGAHLRCRREKPSLDALARPHDVRRRASRVVRDGDNSRRHHLDDAYPKVLVPHGVQADRRAAEPSLQIAPLGVDDKVDVVPDLQLRRQRLASGERVFEDLLQRLIVKNEHLATVELEPDTKLAEEQKSLLWYQRQRDKQAAGLQKGERKDVQKRLYATPRKPEARVYG